MHENLTLSKRAKPEKHMNNALVSTVHYYVTKEILNIATQKRISIGDTFMIGDDVFCMELHPLSVALGQKLEDFDSLSTLQDVAPLFAQCFWECVELDSEEPKIPTPVKLLEKAESLTETLPIKGLEHTDSLRESDDAYRVIGISTGHLSCDDEVLLSTLSFSGECNMIRERDTGWWMKLYTDLENNFYDGMSNELKEIVTASHFAGYQMIEFDGDANFYGFKRFDI